MSDEQPIKSIEIVPASGYFPEGTPVEIYRPQMSPESSKLVHDWMVEHEKASELEFDMETHLPTRAIYHSPVKDWVEQRKATLAALRQLAIDREDDF